MKQAGGAVPEKEREPLRSGEKLLTSGPKSDIMDKRQRVLLMTLRQATIMFLGGLEDFLEMARSIPKRKR